MPDVSPRVLIVGPKPPPLGGIVSVIETIVHGPLAERFAFDWLGISDRLTQTRGLARLANSAVARGFGLEGIVQLETRAKLREFRARLDAGADLVHLHASHSYDFMLAAAFGLAARRRGIPVLLHTHGNYDVVVPRWPPLRRLAFRAALRVPDRTAVLSEGWRRWFGQFIGDDRLAVLRNPVDADRFAAPVREARPELVVLFVGTMDPRRKGAYDLLAWVPDILARVPAARFVLVGLDAEDLEGRLVRGAAWADRVRFTGVRGRGEIEEEFRAADLFVLPSYAEGLPIVLLEAMAAGLPVIAAPVNGVPEALAVPEGGRFAPPGDGTAWVDAIAELAADRELRARMGAANRRRILAEFDARVYARALGKIYDDLLAARGARARLSSPAGRGAG